MTDPCWVAPGGMRTESLRHNLTADVCVIGGGIAGVSVAHALACEQRSVVLLEGKALGAGETGRTTAHLASALDDRFHRLESLHGVAGASLAYESHQQAIERIFELCEVESIECELARVDGFLFLAPGTDPQVLDDEIAAARRAGFAGVERLERIPDLAYVTGPCVRFPRQARFHPLAYLHGLQVAARRRGAKLFTDSMVDRVSGKDRAVVSTRDGFTVEADALVVATNSPIHTRVSVHPKQVAHRTYALAAPVAAGTVPDVLLWDTADPYHYVRRAGFDGREILIVGGEDEPTGSADEDPAPYERLEAWARERFAIESPLWKWSGQVLEPVDSLGFIGRAPFESDHVFVVTGDSGQGMTHGTIAALLVPALLAGREHPWEALYDPGRMTLRATKDLLASNLETVKHYGEWLVGDPGRVADVDEIPAGGGGIVRRHGRLVAVHRTPGGVLVERSAVCTHLGGIVHWNELERSWDCPCHGSRFGSRGEVLNGPATRPLADTRD